MELKHFSEAICKFNVINPQIVDITKKIIVIIGCPGLSNRLDDVVNNIVMAHACHRVDDRNYYNTEFGLQKYCFDDSHPVDQIALVKTLVEEMKNDGLAPHVFVYTNSPFVLQAFFHFNGRPAGDIAFYECGFNETGREILLTDVSADTRTAFTHMADAMNSIMDVTEVFSKKHDAELRRPKFVRFTKEIDYWLEMVELNGKIYDQMDDVAAWSNLRKDFPSLVNDKDEIELLINIENGHIENWPDGKTGDFCTVKIVDTGHYELLDVAQRKLRVLDGYVPEFLSIEDKGYGDYLEFEVDAKGYIKNWKFGDNELAETEKWDECSEN